MTRTNTMGNRSKTQCDFDDIKYTYFEIHSQIVKQSGIQRNWIEMMMIRRIERRAHCCVGWFSAAQERKKRDSITNNIISEKYNKKIVINSRVYLNSEIRVTFIIARTLPLL